MLISSQSSILIVTKLSCTCLVAYCQSIMSQSKLSDEPLTNYQSIFAKDALAGKYAFITGGGSGIGFRIADVFLRHGCKVAIASRSLDRCKVAAQKLEAATGIIKNYTQKKITNKNTHTNERTNKRRPMFIF